MSGSTFSGGSASYGGAIYNVGTLTVTTSTFVNNTASIAGGAIYNDLGGSATLTNNTFSMNSAPTGGGIANVEVTVTLRNVIAANNTASFSGHDLTGNITANFSLLGNTTGANLTGSNNTIGVNPLFGSLGNYNGTTPVLPLLPGSPAIDSGYGANVTDQRGFTVAGPADIGSYQSRGFNVTPASGSSQKVMIGDYCASNLTLSVASSFGEPVNGGVATFTVPSGANMPSAVLTGATTISGGLVSMQASANAFYGSAANQRYNVLGTTSGALAPAAFELLNVGAPSNVTATAGNYQSGNFNSNFTTPISFSVKDSVGNNLDGIAVSFRNVGTSFGANGTINGGSTVAGVTNANGTFGNITYRSNAVGGLVDIVADATVAASAVAGVRPATTATGHAYQGTIGINVQNGTKGRSFVNAVSGRFGSADVVSSLAASQVKIQYLGYDGTVAPVDVTRAASTTSAATINWNYGANSITGNPNTATGDGVYQIAVDYNNDGVYETKVKFHRLFGDVNGDTVVNTLDYNAVMSSAVYGKYNVTSGENTNGVGQVYTKDITTVLRQKGRRITFNKY